MRRPYASRLQAVLALALALAASAGEARAFDPIGWARGWMGATPAEPAGEIRAKVSFEVKIEVEGEDAALRKRLEEASLLLSGGGPGADEPEVLAGRVRADIERLRAALYEAGHYGGEITITIAGKPLPPPGADLTGWEPGERLPVHFAVVPGPLFLFGSVSIDTGSAQAGSVISDAAAFGLVEGAPASSKTLVNAIEKLVEAWRQAGHPLARVGAKEIRADHARKRLDVSVRIAPGPPAQLGWVSLSGADDVDRELVRRYGGLEPGQRYDPAALDKAATRLRKLPAIESVRIQEGREIDHDGGIPLTIAVTERKPRYLGATASMSTIDGGEVKAYWGHHNFFGGAESLRVEAGVSHIGTGNVDDLQYFGKVSLTKPALIDVATDLVLEAGIAKESLDSYDSKTATIKAGLTHKLSETRTASLALAGSIAEESDAVTTRTDAAVSLPASISEDNRDNRLDPASGWRAVVAVEPTYELKREEAYVSARGQVSAYRAIDSGHRLVLAGRIAAAGILGADVDELRPSQRLYAGGGGSVRGFAYRSIAPLLESGARGGSALVEASMELRMRITPTIGLVPFIDAASVSRGDWPDGDAVKIGAGIGLRYYTALGPLRLDIAAPLGDHQGQPDVSFYVGLGQAF